MTAGRKERGLPFRILAAYDSETCNVWGKGGRQAYPVLHQLGVLKRPIEQATPENVESITSLMEVRHTSEAYALFDKVKELGRRLEVVPVIMVHNLAFDMYPLAPYLMRQDVEVCAKSRVKPITFKLLNDTGKPDLVFWDTLVFFQKSLALMGEECGYKKLVGDWDYTLMRTPETVLTENERAYAAHDVYALIAYMGWWLRRNPNVKPEELGNRVITKTGVVRAERKRLFYGLKVPGGRGKVGGGWMQCNEQEAPKTDDELFCMHACTRGGFTFCASRHAGVTFHGDATRAILAYDATSQHPAQMVSHRYPAGFERWTPEELQGAARIVAGVTPGLVLRSFAEPFGIAFNACFEFSNLRPKPGSVFERNGIYPLASARLSRPPQDADTNADLALIRDAAFERGYRDWAVNPRIRFGKLESADTARLWLTELAFWEVVQAYDFDACTAIGGYGTCRFRNPTDYSLLSVMEFYRNKNTFKQARNAYYKGKGLPDADALQRFESAYMVEALSSHDMGARADVEAEYLGLKAQLNALFGIEATNECRRPAKLYDWGIDYDGEDGLQNAPKKFKTWYQFGQRIVGWSRMAQTLVMLLADGAGAGSIVNGDTDSLKLYVQRGKIGALNRALSRYADAVDVAKREVLAGVTERFPDYADTLDGIGHYIQEYEAQDFCAGWNKAYMHREPGGDVSITLAGVPSGLDRWANGLIAQGWTFEEVANTLFGYDTVIDTSITRFKERYAPGWLDVFEGDIRDWRGDVAHVKEPCAVALFDCSKRIDSTEVFENRLNKEQATANNPNLDNAPKLLRFDDAGNPAIEYL